MADDGGTPEAETGIDGLMIIRVRIARHSTPVNASGKNPQVERVAIKARRSYPDRDPGWVYPSVILTASQKIPSVTTNSNGDITRETAIARRESVRRPAMV